MKPHVFWSLLPSLLCAGSVLALTSKPIGNIIPNKFIIEVDTTADIPQKRSFARDLDAVYASIKARDVSFEVVQEFEKPGLFVGASVTIATSDDVAAIETLPGVKAIRPVRMFERPSPATKYVVQGADDPALPPFGTASHILTGVDKLHARGILGTGVKIGILDTGIDYTHPNLGAGIGPGKKVIGGFDFVGDDYTGSNTPQPDNDPLDQCDGHGTHVAGIIGTSSGNEYNVTGVAPEASIIAYRIFGCDGFTQDDIIIAALFKGVDEGADILTLSLGGAFGWTVSSSAVIASRIADSGKIVTIAAGNDGSRGSWYAASPSSAINAISVGSLENTVVPLQAARVSGVDQNSLVYFSLNPLPIEGEYPIYVLSNDTTIPNDACDPLPDSTPDLSKYVTIVRRGTCTFVSKLANIAAKGGKYALIYDNGNGFTAVALGDFTAALIQAADGQYLVSQYLAGADIKVSFPQTGGSVSFPNPTGGLMSTFSSYGPTYDFYFKPAISAPGGNILNTYPTTLGSFAVLSGTSMATPFVAGVSALYLQTKGKNARVAKSARTAFETTARTILSSKEEGALPQTVTQTGAGVINAYDAIFANTTVSPGQLILNDTAHFRGTHLITVTNNAKTRQKYRLTHTPAGTALTVKENSVVTEIGPVPLSDAAARVTIVPSELTLSPGQSFPVVVNIRAPQGVDKSRYPVYSGAISISTGGENYRVTYLGLAASLKEKRILDDSDEYFGAKLPAVVSWVGEPQTAPTNYTFTGTDFPSVVFRLAFGTSLLRLDLVDTSLRLQTNLNPRAPPPHNGPIFTFPQRSRPGSFASVRTIGPIAEYGYLTKDSEVEGSEYNVYSLSRPFFANGTVIPKGTYRLLLRALRVTGDATKQEDYESWVSPVIGVSYP